MTATRGRAGVVAALLAILAVGVSAVADEQARVDHRTTGRWALSGRDGDDLLLFVAADGTVRAWWTARRIDGQATWREGEGRADGDVIHLDVRVPRGAPFGEAPRAEIEASASGTWTLRLVDRSSGVLEWSDGPGDRRGSAHVHQVAALVDAGATASQARQAVMASAAWEAEDHQASVLLLALDDGTLLYWLCFDATGAPTWSVGVAKGVSPTSAVVQSLVPGGDGAGSRWSRATLIWLGCERAWLALVDERRDAVGGLVLDRVTPAATGRCAP